MPPAAAEAPSTARNSSNMHAMIDIFIWMYANAVLMHILGLAWNAERHALEGLSGQKAENVPSAGSSHCSRMYASSSSLHTDGPVAYELYAMNHPAIRLCRQEGRPRPAPVAISPTPLMAACKCISLSLSRSNLLALLVCIALAHHES